MLKTKRIQLATAAALLTCCFTASKSQATLLTLVPDATIIQSGEIVNISVMLTGLDESTDIGAFDVNVTFDPEVVTFTSCTITSQIGSLINGDAVDYSSLTAPGTVNLAALSFLFDPPPQNDPFTLAVVTFTGKNKGVSMLDITASAPGQGLWDFWGNQIPFESENSSITNVTEPPLIALFSSGLLGLAGLYIRRKR